MLLRATHFMSLRGIANGDAVAISRKGHLIIKPTQDTFVLAWRKRRELSVFNRVDRFLSGNPKYRYKACEKCRGDAAQKDNSDLANSVT